MNRHLLLVASLFLSSGVSAAPVPKVNLPKPLPKEVVEAWKKAYCESGWKSSTWKYHEAKEKPQEGWIPCFFSSGWVEGRLKDLPQPKAPFGFSISPACALGSDVYLYSITDKGLKSLAEYDQLVYLNLPQ